MSSTRMEKDMPKTGLTTKVSNVNDGLLHTPTMKAKKILTIYDAEDGEVDDIYTVIELTYSKMILLDNEGGWEYTYNKK